MACLRSFILGLTAFSLSVISVSAQDYRSWDRNSDGMVTRTEWRGTVQEFRERDVNRDGVLSGNELRDAGWASWRQDPAGESFVSLDRNGDGRLTRGEWRGDRGTFLRADLNGDNFISRSEFANLDADYASNDAADFDALDDDGSGRIERDEWSGTRAAFNRMDLDRDGVLSRRELLSNDAIGVNRRDNVIEDTVMVDARQAWTDTGLHATAGDIIRVRADGTIQMMTGADDRATPAGSVTGRIANNSPRPDAPAGTLLLRVGNGPVEAIGANGTVTARTSGRLFLGVNDDHFADNSGQYRVALSVNQR